MKDKKFLALSALFFLMFFAGTAIITLEQPTSQLLRARTENPSPLKSFAVAFPQVGVVNSTKIKVSVYIRDVSGTQLGNRSVKLSATGTGVTFDPSDTLTTNSIGEAQFFMQSSKPGKIQLTATDVESNMSIVNIPTVEFTQ